MFQLYDKELETNVLIYGTKNNHCGFPMFLVKRKNQWVWRSAKHFDVAQ